MKSTFANSKVAQHMAPFLRNLSSLDMTFSDPPRSSRRDPNGPYVNDVPKDLFPTFDEIHGPRAWVGTQAPRVVFLGMYWNTASPLFDMMRLLLPLYFSFYLGVPVYMFIKPVYFVVDYLSGVTRLEPNDNVPTFDLAIARSVGLRDLQTSSQTTRIIISPVGSCSEACDFMYRNDFLFKHPDPSYCNTSDNSPTDKLNLIVINGTLNSYKGQYSFLKHVRPELIRDYAMLFVGKEREQSFEQCIALAKDRGISLICVPFVHRRELCKLIAQCRYQVSYCCDGRVDPNPRSITEGLFAGLPFLVSNNTVLPSIVRNEPRLGLRCAHNPADLNHKLEQLLSLKSEDVLEFVQSTCNYNNVCRDVTEDILKTYEAFRHK